MKNNIIKTIGVVVGIYFLIYLLTGMMGFVGNAAVAIYGLGLVKKKDWASTRILLLFLIVINASLLLWLLFS